MDGTWRSRPVRFQRELAASAAGLAPAAAEPPANDGVAPGTARDATRGALLGAGASGRVFEVFDERRR